MDFIVFHIEGGIGKNIAATAVVSAIKKKYPLRGIVIVTAWEDVWFNNPNIFRVYTFGNSPYFYEDIVKGRDTIVMMHNPYHCTEHIYNKHHLIQTWCNLFDIPYSGEKPELYLTPRELDYVNKSLVSQFNKPILIIQPNGGDNNDIPYSWARDIPFNVSQKIVDKLSLDYAVLQIKRENQPALVGATPITLPIRHIFCLLTFSRKRLLIDSFCQHAAAALELPSTVTWIVNSPNVYGYDIHNNIISDVEERYKTTKYSYLSPFNITGSINEYPYDTNNILDVDKILDSLV